MAIKSWLYSVVERENRKADQINIILTNDEYLREINRKYLSKNYYTDIIAFDNSVGLKVSGDVYISLERVTDNAKELGVENMPDKEEWSEEEEEEIDYIVN